MLFKRGFTIVEIMVVIAVVSIVAGTILITSQTSGQKSRDAERKADLKALQAAVELYKLKYGRYPEGCNDNGSWDGVWSGELGTTYACTNGSAEYIKNDLSATTEEENFSPQFIPRLPADPKLNGSGSGYVYATNPDGTSYKIMAFNTVESETVQTTNEFVRCGDVSVASSMCLSWLRTPNGSTVWGTGSANYPAQCKYNTNTDYQNDYVIYGGYAPGGIYAGAYNTNTNSPKYFTQRIWCK